MSRGRPCQIAIVGMGCRFAGAKDLSTFWENVVAGKDCTREVPPGRWDPKTFCDPASPANDRVPCSRGGYLDSPIEFDAAAHGIMPCTVAGGEPEQFLVLDAAAAALADAGLALSELRKHEVEVVIGRGNYFNRGNLIRLQHGRMIAEVVALLAALHPEWTDADRESIRNELKASLPPFEASTIPGQLTNATAGRLAHRLDLTGASFVVDAASASSLVAVDLCVRALLDHRANLAIAGAVYLEADVDFPLVFRQLNALSPSGAARPFSADADGMVPGEGVAVLVLKRRADAERAGDRIYALVQGIGLASDGRGQGLAAPSARGHARAMRRAYRRAAIDPATVALIEGHGLGVRAADRAELRALNAVFPAPAHGRRSLGAVSSMIGHAMPAAGMAGLIKTALALYHCLLPPTLHAERPHPLLDRSRSAFALYGAARPWIHADEAAPRRAGVNAFGFAGINAHAILEEHGSPSEQAGPGAFRNWDTEALLLWAPDRAGLIDRVRSVMAFLSRGQSHSLKDIAYTLNCAQPHEPGGARLGLVAASPQELAVRLPSVLPYLEDPDCQKLCDARGAYYWAEPLLGDGHTGLAFLFPGEGSQYPGMLADMCFHFPEVRRRFDTADRIALELGETVPPSEYLYGAASGAGEFWTATMAVNVVLCSQWAVYQVLSRLGMRPSAVVGHSSGELLALAAGGVLQVGRDLERQLGRLGAIFREIESSGDMPAARLLAVAASCERLETICAHAGARAVDVAIDNCPHQVVLAGPPLEIERVVGRLRQENLLFEELPFGRAYHTSGFASVLGPIAEFFAQLNFETPRLPVYSCSTRARMPEAPEAIRALAVGQWTRTVAFRETVEAMYRDGLRVFVDVGARGNLAGFVSDILRGRPHFAMAANLPRRAGLAQLNHLLAATFAHGVQLDAEFLYARRRPIEIDWNASQEPRRTTVPLLIGFPEARFSDRLAARLAKAKESRPNQDETDSAGIAQDVPAPLQTEMQEPSHKGDWYDATAGKMAREAPGLAEQNFAPIREPALLHDRAQEGMPRFAALKRDVTVAWPDEVDASMLSFQETMQAFLRTEQEVMAAYLESSNQACAVGRAPAASLLANSLGNGAAEESLIYAESVHDNGIELGTTDPEEALFDRAWSEGPVARPAPDPHSREITATVTGPLPGPWVGEVRRLVDGSELEAMLALEIKGDPIAEHHTLGGRKISELDPTLRGLPVLPFAVMAEMCAEAAALLVKPGLVLTKLKHVSAHKWVRYEDTTVYLELRSRRVDSAEDERAWVGIFNRGPSGDADAGRPVFEAVAVFEAETPLAPSASLEGVPNPRPSRFTAESLYGEQWLFHGPVFQALVKVGGLSEAGIDGVLRVLPLDPLARHAETARFHTDVIVIDSFTHLLGCWGLDYLAGGGDLVFPLRMEELEIFGRRPPEGKELACRIAVREIQRHRIRVVAEIVRADGSVWMRLKDWEDWRFRWPGCYRDVFRQPREQFIGEELPLHDPATGLAAPAKCVWLEPPSDMGRPVWRDVLEQTQLGPAERVAFRAVAGSERERAHRLWERIAAKEAARRLGQSHGEKSRYPADLAIVGRPGARLRLTRVEDPEDLSLPAIAVAHGSGVAVALAALDSQARLGIGVEVIVEGAWSDRAAAFSPLERALLDEQPSPSRPEWVARFASARSAAVQAAQTGEASVRYHAEVVKVDAAAGLVHVRVTSERRAPAQQEISHCMPIVSARRAEHAWAWTLGEGAQG
jgi:acyl transferase domain-containing protein